MIAPLALVFEIGGKRQMIQPWISRHTETTTSNTANMDASTQNRTVLANYPARVLESLGDLCLIGLRRADARTSRQWSLLAQEGAALGFVRFVEPISTLAGHLEDKHHQIGWVWQDAANNILEIAILGRFAATAPVS